MARGEGLRMGMLALVSAAAGLSESLIVAVVAQSAAAMVEDQDRVAMAVGGLRIDQPLAIILTTAAGVGLLRLLLAVADAYLQARIIASVRARMRRDLVEAYTDASWTVQSADRSGYFLEVATSQVNDAGAVMLGATQALATGGTFVVMLVSAIALSPVAALAILLAGGVVAVILQPITRQARLRAKGHSVQRLEVAGAIDSMCASTEEMHVFGVAGARRRQLTTLIDSAEEQFRRRQQATRGANGAFQSIALLLIIGGLALLRELAAPGELATLGAAVLILVRAASYGQTLQRFLITMSSSTPYAVRVRELIARYRDNPRTVGDAAFPPRGSITLDHVWFSYDGTSTALRDLDVRIPDLASVALVGPSGAGKSTVIQLLLGLREPTRGRVLVDGQVLTDIDPDERAAAIAYVPQTPRLIPGDIADNIRYFRDGITQDEVERAAAMAGIHDEIVAMADGYGTEVGRRADAVSGGQRQRICIARALVGGPRVLVLDEPTSALDVRSEQRVQQALETLHGRLTVVIASHRISALLACDTVLHVHEGQATLRRTADLARDPRGLPAVLEAMTGEQRPTPVNGHPASGQVPVAPRAAPPAVAQVPTPPGRRP